MAVTPFDPPYPKTSSCMHANFTPLCFIEPKLLLIEVYIAGIGIFDLFGSCDLDLDTMTFIYELDLCSVEICRM